MSKIQYVLIALAAAVVILAAGSIYTVNQGEQALVLQFGRPVRVVKEPGLKLKIPMIQNVVFYDARLLNLDPPAQEVVLNDKKRLDVDSFTRYRIIDPLKFYKTVRTEYQAQSKLAEIVNSSIRKILGRSTLQELLSQKRTQIMNDISAAVKVDAEQIGVSVADVRIRRADLPLEVLQAINARMKTEREREAKEFRAQGSQEAQKIKASADKEKTIILADAEKQAQIIRGQGDEQAIMIWNKAAGQDMEFFAFYRSLEAYKNALTDGNASMVLSPDSEFFQFFRHAVDAVAFGDGRKVKRDFAVVFFQFLPVFVKADFVKAGGGQQCPYFFVVGTFLSFFDAESPKVDQPADGGIESAAAQAVYFMGLFHHLSHRFGKFQPLSRGGGVDF